MLHLTSEVNYSNDTNSEVQKYILEYVFMSSENI